VYLWSSSASFRNNLLLENYAEVAGGGLYLDLTQVELHNLTVVGNEAGGINSGNGVFFGPGANPLLRSCILWENGHGTFDEGYHNDGVSTVTEPEARNCIISSLQGDDAENNLLDDGAYFQETSGTRWPTRRRAWTSACRTTPTSPMSRSPTAGGSTAARTAAPRWPRNRSRWPVPPTRGGGACLSPSAGRA